MIDPKRKKILLVEDTDSVQLMMKWWITNDGFDVDAVSDGREALEKVMAATPDLIVLDVMMPGLNGYAVCRALRELENTRATPIIIITALQASADSEEARRCGANEVMIKPLNKDEFIRKIRTYLGSVFTA
jgi:DNA-binding response OmpR family regulator